MENNELKYKCEKCNYLTNYKSSYDKHLRSILHQTGEKKIRSDKKENKCDRCEKSFSSQQSLKNHILNKHLDVKKEINIKKEITEYKHYCKYCNLGSDIKSNYEKHLESKKHIYISKLKDFNIL